MLDLLKLANCLILYILQTGRILAFFYCESCSRHALVTSVSYRVSCAKVVVGIIEVLKGWSMKILSWTGQVG